MNRFHTRNYVLARHLIYLTQWCAEEELPTLFKFQNQVLKDPARTAVIVQDRNVYAVAVDKVGGMERA